MMYGEQRRKRGTRGEKKKIKRKVKNSKRSCGMSKNLRDKKENDNNMIRQVREGCFVRAI